MLVNIIHYLRDQRRLFELLVLAELSSDGILLSCMPLLSLDTLNEPCLLRRDLDWYIFRLIRVGFDISRTEVVEGFIEVKGSSRGIN